jgi:predicted SnoaL-like aldol condensation-catalyzing enzyme
MSDLEKNKEIVRTFSRDAFNDHDLSRLSQYMRDDYIQHNPDCPQGMGGFVGFFKQIFGAVPDFKYSIKQMIAEGDLVWMYSGVSGTHTGGGWLDVPPSGNKLDFDAVDMFRIQNGKIAEHWDVADTFKLFSQIGKIK